jgi:hypothetical protein
MSSKKSVSRRKRNAFKKSIKKRAPWERRQIKKANSSPVARWLTSKGF